MRPEIVRVVLPEVMAAIDLNAGLGRVPGERRKAGEAIGMAYRQNGYLNPVICLKAHFYAKQIIRSPTDQHEGAKSQQREKYPTQAVPSSVCKFSHVVMLWHPHQNTARSFAIGSSSARLLLAPRGKRGTSICGWEADFVNNEAPPASRPAALR
ncbi:hypothetical protein M9978_11555 [Sphingomonas sp. MG17]|uniref:Uncharacterized protein n=1 Tax=Sphingomonas tagetis TaxID=2949092 RepID=A0A9X2HHR9_9SPHN|nr:hypothetical protein [Sphingomonas tagetis]MCP3731063.1 hypothetical protein [Sphingomonas tagetis]